MLVFEWVAALLVAAVVLNALAGRLGVPYPALLALGGVTLAFMPGAPRLTLDPALALALFVAPVLVDAAYDASPRDLRRNLKPVVGLVVGAIVATTAAVAIAAHRLRPDLPWAAAIALGAMVSPPDAVSATAVLRQFAVPRRILIILEGESLLNDAMALLIYRAAIGALAAGAFNPMTALPIFFVGVLGSLAAGLILARIVPLLISRVDDPAAAVVLQFCSTFGVWILAERLGLSGVLTIVAYAISLAREASARTPARIRVPSYAVWEAAVFILNALAFILIGLQVRPILDHSTAAEQTSDFAFAGAILLVTILVRIVYVMGFTAMHRLVRRIRRRPDGSDEQDSSFKGAFAVSWSGMRGIVTLAAAFALPEGGGAAGFPHRDLIVLTAFVVVLGTLLVQGTTLRPLFALLAFRAADPVEEEVAMARGRVYRAALDSIEAETSRAADTIRSVYHVALESSAEDLRDDEHVSGNMKALRLHSLAAGRDVLFALRHGSEIGDDAFHRVEAELDRAQVAAEGLR